MPKPERNRRSRKEASVKEEARRAEAPLCMFNDVHCAGEVREWRQRGRAFGQEVETPAVVCEVHLDRLRLKVRRPKATPQEQLELPL